ncbi:glycosyltransferase N-terminal domain-containing protein [Octadecabacter sp. 1_MG-2023]|uniref:3-deoxy-D-manno-octulosonic acid transferase n=1 Tax=unclassified Octadecabacter TaxID=196158 RepID=UPI001C09C522|nr:MULTISPECIES: glycosyltransferase N-terminal domain-containing protein [unclassified Octadecabacter]MBU2994687.1 3-deoxy-D-manno-octulosonic acid transferase [Octadecabacter sp. B2R22]MDO6734019.1 glycosyltransferase N-terminal domain-containing protein [Octadecabacter sp. 1_MG-2023]
MILNAFLALYRLAWVLLTPLVLVYLWHRGRRDPVYKAHLHERFGSYAPLPQNPIWIHAVSLGETRSAVPMARDLLAAGETIVFTHFTPAGRKEAHRAFGTEIADGRVASVWVPLDMFWTFSRFFRACRPKIGLSMEIEIWPAMVFAAKKYGVPFYMCNAQYPSKSLTRDSGGLRLRQKIMTGFAGAFVKSQLQADRFASIGVPNIHITGELRFDQPIAPALLAAAAATKPLLKGRPVVTIASAVEGEDDIYIQAIKDVLAHDPRTLFIYVPRAPERFDDVAKMLISADLPPARRSEMFSETLDMAIPGHDWIDGVQVLLGDSLGEMYFYLALADRVIVGGGFNSHGAHNIIEPLALAKPVVTGPTTYTIEYPFVEAEAAGVAKSVETGAQMVELLSGPTWTTVTDIDAFIAAHSGASARTCAAIKAEIERP